jgi:hypothetical protein
MKPLLLILMVLAQRGPPGHPRVDDISNQYKGGTPVTSDVEIGGSAGICGIAPTTDTAPVDLVIHSAAAYPQGTQTASNVIVAGGLDEKSITCSDFANAAGDSVVTTVNGVALAALVEGTDWDCITSDAVCCANLATAMNAQSGISAVAVTTTVYLTPDQCPTWGLSTAITDAGGGAFGTSDNGTDGIVIFPGDTYFEGSLIVTSTRHIDITMGAANLGPTAPSFACAGSACGLAFDADAEQAALVVDIPESWNGASDMTLTINWTNESGSAIPDTKQGIWDFDYRSIARSGETVSQGTAVAGTVTYTQSGAGTDGELLLSTITIPWNTGNQPDITGEAGNTYAGDAVAILAELLFTSDSAISSH